MNIVPLLLLLLLSSSVTHAGFIPPAPTLNASGYILVDAHSGQTLVTHNGEERLEPASLTKIMTGYVVFKELTNGRIRLDEEVLISEKAWRTPGSRMFVEVGTRVSVETLIKGMVIQSGNDASVALAEFVAGSEEAFAALMNNHAKTLGMINSHFINSTGLPHQDHYTTAADMALLARAVITQFPDYYRWYSEKQFTYNNIKQSNRNLLLFRDKSVDGFKTGHTDAAGYCLVASAQREEMRLITVVMGTKSERARADESQKLLNFGFRFYETHRLYGAEEPLKQIRVWQGAQQQLSIGIRQELFVTVPRGQYEQMQAAVAIDSAVIAPIEAGQTMGRVEIRMEQELIASPELIALHQVERGSLFQQLKDKLLMMIE